MLSQGDKDSGQAESRREHEDSLWREQLSWGPDEETVTRWRICGSWRGK